MRLYLDTQIATYFEPIPTKETLRRWIKIILNHLYNQSEIAFEITIRFVDSEESQSLNFQYREKNKPTNVLSFPNPLLNPSDPHHYLGDLVICLDIVKNESVEQHKTFYHHLTHMITHGILHLIGYDHIDDKEAEAMESLEIDILKNFNIKNPYLMH